MQASRPTPSRLPPRTRCERQHRRPARVRNAREQQCGTAAPAGADRAPVPTGCNPGCKVSATGGNCDQLAAALRSEIPPEATGSFRLGAGRSQVQILSPRLKLLQISLNFTSVYHAGCAAVFNPVNGAKVVDCGRRRFREPATTRSFAPRRPIAPRALSRRRRPLIEGGHLAPSRVTVAARIRPTQQRARSRRGALSCCVRREQPFRPALVLVVNGDREGLSAEAATPLPSARGSGST